MASKYDCLTRRRICSALNCTNSPGRDLNISLFRFPKDKERCRQWLTNCQREDLMKKDHTCLYNNYRLCSAHFENSQFYNPRVKNKLIWNSVPTIFMHNTSNLQRLNVRTSYAFNPEGSQENVEQRDKSNSQDMLNCFETLGCANAVILEDNLQSLNLSVKQNAVCQFYHGVNETQKIITRGKGYSYLQASLHSLPDNLVLRPSVHHINFYGIWSQEDIPEGTRFGPYGGILINDSDDAEVTKANRRKLDVISPNWLEYINHAFSREQQNLAAFQFQEQIFYISCKHIPANTELLAGYRYENGCTRTGIANENRFELYKVPHTYHRPYGYEKKFSLQRYLKLQNKIQTDLTLCAYEKKHKMFYTAEKYYKCDECEKHFTQYTELKRHKWLHNGVKPYKCNECGKKFTQNYYLKIHKRRLHTGEKPYKCGECGKKYAQNSDLNRHKRLHTEENPYKCDECGKQFIQYNTLNSHKMRLHTREKPFQCDECGKKFAENRGLRRHKARLHDREKPYECRECGKKYAFSSDLKNHTKRAHSKENPFKCDVCGRNFTLKYRLKIHKWKHVKHKSYKCDKCGGKFPQNCILKTHQMPHIGEKPYECDKCRKSLYEIQISKSIK